MDDRSSETRAPAIVRARSTAERAAAAMGSPMSE